MLSLVILALFGCNKPQEDPDKVIPLDVPEAGLQRLSAVQWTRAVQTVMGVTIDTSGMPEDARTPFDNDWTLQSASRGHVETQELYAEEATRSWMSDQDLVAQHGCVPDRLADTACFETLARSLSRLAWRGQVTDADVDALVAGALLQEDVDSALLFLGRAVLLDPGFTYRIEVGQPTEREGIHQLTDHEVVTRMAFDLWNRPPDRALLNRADLGGLAQPAERRALFESMWNDPRTMEQISTFHAEWLGYDVIELPGQSTSVDRAALRREADEMVIRVNQEGRPWREVFLMEETFLEPRAALHYGRDARAVGQGAWVEMDVFDEGRAGLLSTAAFLSVANTNLETSPTRRGLHIRERLMCAPVPPPPADVDADAPPEQTTDSYCKVDRYAQHAVDPGCAACHDLMDPIGFGLENFDRDGLYIEYDTPVVGSEPYLDCPIDGQGELAGLTTFRGPGELGQALVAFDLVEPCLVEHWAQWSLGRSLVDEDEPVLTRLRSSFRTDGVFKTLIQQRIEDPTYIYRKVL